MIKINKTLGLALLTALAASCSSDNDVAQSTNPNLEKGESAFATLRINLPTQQGSRAATFEDGQPSEYKVNDATLLVFKKNNDTDAEGAYTFVQYVNLGNMNPWDEPYSHTDSEITTQATVTAQLDQTDYKDLKDGNIYGLVILNNGTDKAQKISLPKVGTTFSAWNVEGNVNATNMLATSNGIVMANAPEWKKAGDTPTTLVPIDGKKVYTTAAQAEAAGDVAANIYVERGLAKVTMEAVPVQSPKGSGYTKDKVGIFAWALDVTNLKSFPVHMVEGFDQSYPDIWKEEGTGDNKVAKSANNASINRFHDVSGIGDFKRVYWGMDPNYNRDPETGDFKKITDGKDLKSGFKDDNGENPQYCLENTFDIDHMKQNQTTRVIFAAAYKLNGATAAATFYKIDGKKELYSADKMKDVINAAVKAAGISKADGIDFTLTLPTKAGKKALDASNFPAVFRKTTLDDTEIKKVNDQLNGEILTYENGVCYYIGRIKHFGDDETPWNQVDPTYGTGDDANLKYLGRYGVLRNNWYDLKVHSIYGPGEPTIPDTPDTPDDDKNYIDLSVKVLKWAKRGQTLHF